MAKFTNSCAIFPTVGLQGCFLPRIFMRTEWAVDKLATTWPCKRALPVTRKRQRWWKHYIMLTNWKVITYKLVIHSMHPHVTFAHSVWEVSAMLAMVVWFFGRLLLTYRNWFASKDQPVGDCGCISHEVVDGVIMVSCEHGLLRTALPCVIYICCVPCDVYSKYGRLRVMPRGRIFPISGDNGQCSSEGASYPTVFRYLVGCTDSHWP